MKLKSISNSLVLALLIACGVNVSCAADAASAQNTSVSAKNNSASDKSKADDVDAVTQATELDPDVKDKSGSDKAEDNALSLQNKKDQAESLNDPALDVEDIDEQFEVVEDDHSASNVYPCPFGWSVIPNPSVDNSLTYQSSRVPLAVSVTSVKQSFSAKPGPEAYAKVAAEQMFCNMPYKSNLIEDAYSFECPLEMIEVIIYGEPGELVMLAVSGRNKDTEADLEEFIKFLAFEAKNK